MKKNLLTQLTCLIILLSACNKSQDGTPATPPANDLFNPANATLLKSGNFTGSANYSVNGSVKLYDFQGKKYIYFENFTSSNGPDLKVYIATTNTATQFVNLGNLKGVSGSQAYLINNPPDLNQFNKVLIWCQQFTALFGSATLQ